jgi:predicted nucleic acid-binding protein
MSGVFLDTGYLIALVNKRDNFHDVAVTASKRYQGPFFTTQLVIIELANSLCLPAQRPLALKIIEKMQIDPLTTIVELTSARYEEALNLYKKRSDKAWGMIDCFSFNAMDEFGIRQALTFDEHFRQAGYRVPLL